MDHISLDKTLSREFSDNSSDASEKSRNKSVKATDGPAYDDNGGKQQLAHVLDDTIEGSPSDECILDDFSSGNLSLMLIPIGKFSTPMPDIIEETESDTSEAASGASHEDKIGKTTVNDSFSDKPQEQPSTNSQSDLGGVKRKSHVFKTEIADGLYHAEKTENAGDRNKILVTNSLEIGASCGEMTQKESNAPRRLGRRRIVFDENSESIKFGLSIIEETFKSPSHADNTGKADRKKVLVANTFEFGATFDETVGNSSIEFGPTFNESGDMMPKLCPLRELQKHNKHIDAIEQLIDEISDEKAKKILANAKLRLVEVWEQNKNMASIDDTEKDTEEFFSQYVDECAVLSEKSKIQKKNQAELE